MELTDGDLGPAMRVGVGAAKGRFYGIVVKLSIGAVMLLVVLVAAIPIGGAAPTAPTAPVAPATTAPTTGSLSAD
jgi:hypothetical protein